MVTVVNRGKVRVLPLESLTLPLKHSFRGKARVLALESTFPLTYSSRPQGQGQTLSTGKSDLATKCSRGKVRVFPLECLTLPLKHSFPAAYTCQYFVMHLADAHSVG